MSTSPFLTISIIVSYQVISAVHFIKLLTDFSYKLLSFLFTVFLDTEKLPVYILDKIVSMLFFATVDTEFYNCTDPFYSFFVT